MKVIFYVCNNQTSTKKTYHNVSTDNIDYVLNSVDGVIAETYNMTISQLTILSNDIDIDIQTAYTISKKFDKMALYNDVEKKIIFFLD